MNRRHVLAAWTAAAALAAMPGAALAAVDAFIWFDSVAGSSNDAAHPGWFEIKDFSFGVENPTTVSSASAGAGAGKANTFTIKRVKDGASAVFQRAAGSGQRYSVVKVEMRKAGDPHQFMAYRFTNVSVTKVQWSGPGDEGPEESITFVYGAVATAPQGAGQRAPATQAPAQPH